MGEELVGGAAFLHCAVAFAPAPVGLTKKEQGVGWRPGIWRCGVGEIAGVEDYVVAFAVAVGTGHAEAEAGGFEDEGEFGEFSAALGVAFAIGGSFWAKSWDALLSDRPRARR